jgi:hypothetical protein
MELLLVFGLFVLLAVAALCWGCDSRDGLSDSLSLPRRPGLF